MQLTKQQKLQQLKQDLIEKYEADEDNNLWHIELVKFIKYERHRTYEPFEPIYNNNQAINSFIQICEIVKDYIRVQLYCNDELVFRYNPSKVNK